ncbi:MAG: aminotransferase class V-fold PLP-dependent enzyme [Candidatus Hydrogenedentota bacterium]|nr:MAG: aminotransferase class V-fold PLP-dependent enzyme [Candidatus Hydrogenedentota bacterium]
MLYLDFAALSWPFAKETILALEEYNKNPIGSPGRSSHAFSLEEFRQDLQEFLGIDHIPIITPNATYAANIFLQKFKENQSIPLFLDQFLHNSVIRPAFVRKTSRIVLKRENGLLDLPPNAAEALLCLTLTCNVTGWQLKNIDEIASWQKASSMRWILADASQYVGKTDLRSLPFAPERTIYFFSAHKALLAPPSLGFLIVPQTLKLKPFVYGGTGFDSANIHMPEKLPYRLEAGTYPLLSLIGLHAALKRGLPAYQEEAQARENYAAKIYDAIESTEKLIPVSAPPKEQPSGIVSFYHKNLPASEVGYILEQEFNLILRYGYHCSPWHFQIPWEKVNNTNQGEFRFLPPEGIVRLSPTHALTQEEVDKVCAALKVVGEF